jgi:multicomponent Na+:H+ antiporter subunit G
MTEYIAMALIATGLIFFMAGSIGLLRLPDLYSRLHALTKADNVGLGMMVLGIIFISGDLLTTLKLILVWLLVLASSAASAHLIAQRARRSERGLWKP